jgi:hypothetical protein
MPELQRKNPECLEPAKVDFHELVPGDHERIY